MCHSKLKHFYGDEPQIETKPSDYITGYNKYEINDASGRTTVFLVPNLDPAPYNWSGYPVDVIEDAQGYSLDDPISLEYEMQRGF